MSIFCLIMAAVCTLRRLDAEGWGLGAFVFILTDLIAIRMLLGALS